MQSDATTQATPRLASTVSMSSASSREASPLSALMKRPLPVPRAHANHIDQLPTELVIRIYSYLNKDRDRWAFMCTQWRWFAAAVDTMWYRPTIAERYQLAPLAATLRSPAPAIDYGRLIRRVNLSAVANVLTDNIVLAFAQCHEIERFVVSDAVGISESVIEKVIEANPRIQSIDISQIGTLSDRVLIALARTCGTNLQGIYASGCVGFTDEGVAHLASRCSSLKRVKFAGCPLISDLGLQMVTTGCGWIMELDISNCASEPGLGGISDSLVHHIFANLKYIRELRLAGNPEITDDAFRLPEDTLLAALRVIDLTSCAKITDEAIIRLVQLAPRLHNLVLAKCFNISDRSLNAIATLDSSLHYLHIGHCARVSDRGVSIVARSCPRLQYIDVANCIDITNAAVHELAALPRLRRIGLVKCMRVNDTGIAALAARRGSESTLERVHLSYCTLLTAVVIKKLVNACPRLTHLSVTGVPAMNRPEYAQFCRTPPPDLTEHQQSVFCVYSGEGVRRLREFLNRDSHYVAPHAAPRPRVPGPAPATALGGVPGAAAPTAAAAAPAAVPAAVPVPATAPVPVAAGGAVGPAAGPATGAAQPANARRLPVYTGLPLRHPPPADHPSSLPLFAQLRAGLFAVPAGQAPGGENRLDSETPPSNTPTPGEPANDRPRAGRRVPSGPRPERPAGEHRVERAGDAMVIDADGVQDLGPGQARFWPARRALFPPRQATDEHEPLYEQLRRL